MATTFLTWRSPSLYGRFAGRKSVTLVEFASGNMYGPVVTLAALARLGIEEVDHHNNTAAQQHQHHGVLMPPKL